MNYFDIILLVILLVFGMEGYRKGFFRETLKVVGMILVIYISFIFMNPVGNVLLENLPLISLHIIGVEIQSLNILFYQLISFISLCILLFIILNLILNITGLLTKVMGLSRILKLPLKILGGVVGLVTGYIFLFLVLIIFSVPINSKIDGYKESKVKNIIIDNKILMTKSVKKVSNSIGEIYDLTYRIDKDEDRLEHSKIYDSETMNIMLKNKIISIDTIDKLIERNKLKTYNELNDVIIKYKEENTND